MGEGDESRGDATAAVRDARGRRALVRDAPECGPHRWVERGIARAEAAAERVARLGAMQLARELRGARVHAPPTHDDRVERTEPAAVALVGGKAR
ncbi:MAG TPA: hypothetical protein RMH99_01145 [Sandaracinaceae bacterium LLY-WYZ-13_1]|nr:hypothetical protein [Sandaracinaceae bacterium LLY-WYZ-13_1]